MRGNVVCALTLAEITPQNAIDKIVNFFIIFQILGVKLRIIVDSSLFLSEELRINNKV